MVRRRDNRAQGPGTSRSEPAARHAEDARVGAARHLNVRNMPLWLKVTTAVVSVVLLGGLAFAGYWYFRLQSNISTSALGAGNGRTDTIDDATGRMQILILGSDTRDGKNATYGSADDSTGYGNSDVMMLMDISEDNKRVNVISFPRDLLVDIPKCTDQKTGKEYPARTGVMINEAMNEAGIGCAVDTVNKLTGLEVDHFMMADFNAVKELSNTVGGVDVCISDSVYDPDSRLRLPKGTSQVKGEQALAFLRTRHAFADGGDLGRIKAQQGFLSSLTRKIKDDGTLSDPAKMLTIADVVTQNLTVDEGLASVPAMITIGNRLKTIDVGKVAFVAVPTAPAASDPNRLDPAQPAASQLFAALKEDIDLTDPEGKATPSPSATPSASAKPSATPTPTKPAAPYDKTLQPVTVANGTGVPTRTQEIAEAVIAGGFTQVVPLEADPAAKTFVYYGPEFADVAKDVAALLGIPAGQIAPSPGLSGVQVYLGADFTSGTKFGKTTVPKDIVNQTAGDTVCQQANPELIVQQ
ncbi:LCP family protein [Arthrobacter sp. ISL-5]|uniref:LCP family protein n=1 Tax=Arthrobacter sp. ISL-5 TaxID=2819111 RepID=UPI001BE77018|nr:LCP family protein [Arthrobacter sp. ISL-5]MBT2551874.1 LCP family protein [Arthrobacter sp. ISL-5]